MGGRRGNNSTQNNLESQGRTGKKSVCSQNSIIQATQVLFGQKPLHRKLTGEFDCIIEQQTLGQILFGTHLSNITKTIPLGVSPQSARRREVLFRGRANSPKDPLKSTQTMGNTVPLKINSVRSMNRTPSRGIYIRADRGALRGNRDLQLGSKATTQEPGVQRKTHVLFEGALQ